MARRLVELFDAQPVIVDGYRNDRGSAGFDHLSVRRQSRILDGDVADTEVMERRRQHGQRRREAPEDHDARRIGHH